MDTIFRAATIFLAQSPNSKATSQRKIAKIRMSNIDFVSTDACSTSNYPIQRCDSIAHDNVLLKEITFDGLKVPSPKDYELQHRVEKIKEIMSSKAKGNDELDYLIIVDVIHRLGLEDYFQEEIYVSLERLRAKFCGFKDGDQNNADFYEVALSFRLLRQYGYYVPADIYNKFKDKDGKFKEELGKDVKALLSVFESCQTSTPTEEILDEASDFCGQLLIETSIDNNIIDEQSHATIIENTLRNPCHKSLARLSNKKDLQNFNVSLKFLHKLSEVEHQWINEVYELARIDFDMAQISYRNEIQKISRWGKQLNLDKELVFARIEPFKWCMWSLGIFPGPNMSEERLELAKAVSFIYMIDDIFDSHPTYEDLYFFTEAVSRWELAGTERLPKCMKVCFDALIDMTNDFSSKIQRKYGWNPEQCLRKLWAEQFEAYLVESKWNFAKYSPSPEEYLNNAIVTSGAHIVLAHAFFLKGQGINTKGLEELNSLPSIIASTATILRLWNDAGIHTDKTPDGNDGSYLDCYMKEQKSSSIESARCHISDKISEAWKCLNEEYMSPFSPFSKDFKLACLNLARMVPIMYSHDHFLHLRLLLENLDFNSLLDETLINEVSCSMR